MTRIHLDVKRNFDKSCTEPSLNFWQVVTGCGNIVDDSVVEEMQKILAIRPAKVI